MQQGPVYFPKTQISPWPLSSPAGCHAEQSGCWANTGICSTPGTCTAPLPQEHTDPLHQICSGFCLCDFFKWLDSWVHGWNFRGVKINSQNPMLHMVDNTIQDRLYSKLQWIRVYICVKGHGLCCNFVWQALSELVGGWRGLEGWNQWNMNPVESAIDPHWTAAVYHHRPFKIGSSVWYNEQWLKSEIVRIKPNQTEPAWKRPDCSAFWLEPQYLDFELLSSQIFP